MSEIILALDFDTEEKSIAFASLVQKEIKWVKVGLELFCKAGTVILPKLKDLGFNIFLDLKLFDIPNTVKGAIKNILKFHIDMLTLHLLGGENMIKEAVNVKNSLRPECLILGVTILTSLSKNDLVWSESRSISDVVLDLAQKGLGWGVDGVVLSPLELEVVRDKLPQLTLVTPGIRLATDKKGDQKRVLSPYQATLKGADFLVIGRSITKAKDPLQTIKTIKKEIKRTKQ
ncbi:orotidine-5'-phosphate decarboxylase [Desulfonauticus submarinus]